MMSNASISGLYYGLSLFGSWQIVVPLQIVVAAFALAWGRVRLLLFSLSALAIAVAAVLAARAVVDLRPDAFEAADIVQPSGHSALTMVLVATMMVLNGWVEARPRRYLGYAFALVVALTIPTLMVHRGHHTVGDVLVGGTLGIASVLLAELVARRARRDARAQ